MFYRDYLIYTKDMKEIKNRLPGVKTYKILVKRICQKPWDHQRNDPVRDYSNSGCSPQENWVEVVLNHIKRGATCFYSPFPIRAGKTPAAQISRSHPIVNHLEVKVGDDKQILVDNSSISGLFNYFLNDKAVPIMCTDECQGFFNRMLYPSKGSNDQSLTMERMCKLYDGDAWYSVKGSKGKRIGTQFE